MPPDRLTPLQRRILRVLAALDPAWTLTGGGALAGVYLGHRTTRDLDLFWRGRPALADPAGEAATLLREAGCDVVVLRTAPAFAQLRVTLQDETCVVDLVAEPFPSIEPPRHETVEGGRIAVDSMHEILVAKLTRDLIDVRALLDAGLDLAAALRDAPRKTGAFPRSRSRGCSTRLTSLHWPRRLAGNPADAAALDAFRQQLADRLVEIARPGA